MNKLKVMHLLLLGLFIMASTPMVYAGHPCAHILICCRATNEGIKFEVNGKWEAAHNYGDIEQARGIMQNLKEAGIKSVIVDMTNMSQWEHLWKIYHPMVLNIQQVCREKQMQYFVFIGAAEDLAVWNSKAKYIWEHWAQDPIYRKYGFGDDRPILLVFGTSKYYWPKFKQYKPEDVEYLSKFHIGTTQVNTPEVAEESDGWGYRSMWQNKSGSVRLASPNGGISPKTWHHIDKQEWAWQVNWAKQANEYSIYGSYDDTCDAFFWGIADTWNNTPAYYNIYPENNPRYYYDILKDILVDNATYEQLDVKYYGKQNDY